MYGSSGRLGELERLVSARIMGAGGGTAMTGGGVLRRRRDRPLLVLLDEREEGGLSSWMMTGAPEGA